MKDQTTHHQHSRALSGEAVRVRVSLDPITISGFQLISTSGDDVMEHRDETHHAHRERRSPLWKKNLLGRSLIPERQAREVASTPD